MRGRAPWRTLGTMAAVEALNAWIRSHVRQLAAAVAGGLGVYLVTKGVVAL